MESQEKSPPSDRSGGWRPILRRYRWLLLALMLVVVAGRVAYGVYTSKYLPYETILIAPGTDEYEKREPMLMITTRAEELPQLESNVWKGIHQELDRVDFEDYFLITVSQGYRDTLGFGVEIQNLTLSEREITVNTHFVTPVPGRGLQAAVCSPHHIVKVRKGNLQGTYREVLRGDGQYLLEESVTLP